MEFFLKLSGILLGVLVRTLVPYLRKLRQGKVKEAGFGWNSLVSEGAKWGERVKK